MKIRKSDIILIISVIAAGAAIAVVLLLAGGRGSKVQVKVSGQVVKTFSLDQNIIYEIEGKGGGKNVLVIDSGKAWVDEADCPDKLCMNMGKISRSGQSIVCLPNEVVIEITGTGPGDDDVDIVVN